MTTMVCTGKHDWFKQMIEAGFIPHGARRMIIDLNVGDVAKVYFESRGDKQMFDTDLVELLKAEGGDPPKVVPVDEATLKREKAGEPKQAAEYEI